MSPISLLVNLIQVPEGGGQKTLTPQTKMEDDRALMTLNLSHIFQEVKTLSSGNSLP